MRLHSYPLVDPILPYSDPAIATQPGCVERFNAGCLAALISSRTPLCMCVNVRVHQ